MIDTRIGEQRVFRESLSSLYELADRYEPGLIPEGAPCQCRSKDLHMRASYGPLADYPFQQRKSIRSGAAGYLESPCPLGFWFHGNQSRLAFFLPHLLEYPHTFFVRIPAVVAENSGSVDGVWNDEETQCLHQYFRGVVHHVGSELKSSRGPSSLMSLNRILSVATCLGMGDASNGILESWFDCLADRHAPQYQEGLQDAIMEIQDASHPLVRPETLEQLARCSHLKAHERGVLKSMLEAWLGGA